MRYPILRLIIVGCFALSLFGTGTASAATIALSWDPPVSNNDGTPYTNLSGYKIYYGTSSGNYSQSIDVGNVVTYTLNNLSDGVTYYFVTTAYDTSNVETPYSNEIHCLNTTSSCAGGSGGGSDTTPPVISGINAGSIISTSANISWSTNEPSDTQVEYGATTSYGYNTTLNTSLVASHSQTINGLSPSTLYHYRVRSRDAAGNLAI